jgi:hypothetical protein
MRISLAHALLRKGPSLVSPHRSSPRGLALSFACIAGVFATACYTGPINMRPTISIKPPATRYTRGSTPTFQATASDPEGQRVKVEWTATEVPCPSPAQVQQRAYWPATDWMEKSEYLVPADKTKKPFCVWAKATDNHGAVAIDAVDGRPDNHPPVAKLQRKPSTSAVPIGKPIVFTVSWSDEDPDDNVDPEGWFFDSAPVPKETLQFTDCPAPDDQDKSKRCFTPTAEGRYDVYATVTDHINISAPATNWFEVQPPNVPIARLELKSPIDPATGPYPLGTRFHVSGGKSSDADNDMLTPTWSTPAELKAKAPTSGASLVACEGESSDLERCFRADAPGTYHVSLTLFDGMVNSTPEVMELVVVDDTPPCLKETTPAFKPSTVAGIIDPEEPITWFRVLKVKDDLDPYPPEPGDDPLHDKTTFRWSVDDGGGFRPAWGDFASFPFMTDGYAYGDEVLVRLEIFDRLTIADPPPPCTGTLCMTSVECPYSVTWKVVFKL